jgi:hypothetical protein
MNRRSGTYLRILAILALALTSARAQFVAFSSSNLPVIAIETSGRTIPNEPKSAAWMRVYDSPRQRNDLATDRPLFEGWIGIELRGNGSLIYPKQQFGIETRDSSGGDLDVPLLGMPADADWVLAAAASDKTLLRDALGMSIAASLGQYASRTRFCELLIDGIYQGVYILHEKIKRGARRVDIAKLTPSDSQGVALTGGYIFKMDPGKGLAFEGWSASFDSLGYFSYFYHYPGPESITFLQRAYLGTWFREFENAMRADDYADPVHGYRAIIDVPSFIDHMIVQEATFNGDGYAWSTYFQKDRDDRGRKLVIGPVWDLHSAFGNSYYGNGGLAEGWRIHSEHRPFYWYRLLADSSFLRDLRRRWWSVRATVLADTVLLSRIDSLATLIGEARERNFLRWNVMGIWQSPNSYVGLSYEDELLFLKRWLQDRLAWIDAHIDGLSHEVVRPEMPRRAALRTVHPNPAARALYVTYVLKEYADIELDLIDLWGRTMVRYAGRALAAGVHTDSFDLTAIPIGAYRVRLSVAGAVQDARIVQVLR